MPSPEQVRQQRIEKLFADFNGKNITVIDPIIRRAFEKYPFLKARTATEYAEAILRMLEAKKRETKSEKTPPRTP